MLDFLCFAVGSLLMVALCVTSLIVLEKLFVLALGICCLRRRKSK